MNRLTIVSAAICLASAAAGAQRSALVGSVRVKDTATPLTIAEVEIPALGLKTRVTETGEFEFPTLPPGRHLVVVRAIGYSPRGDTITIVAARETRRHFDLPRVVTQLDTAMVMGSARYISPLLRAFEERSKSGFGRFIGEDQLRKSDNKEFMEVIRQVPGLMVIRQNGSTYVVSSRRTTGPRGAFLGGSKDSACYATIYQDGVLAFDQLAMKISPPRLEDFNVREWAGIEYYAGDASLPAKFKSSPCGVLLLWSRER